MRVLCDYGRTGLEVEIPSAHVNVISPAFVPGLADERAAFRAALGNPIQSRPLRDLIHARDRVAVVIPDITRPFPSDRLLPWLLAELSHVALGNITIINGTGSHRVNTSEELVGMVGREVFATCRVVNHNAHEPATLAPAGRAPDGRAVRMNKEYVAADKRIILGFIEPHFMAGFSGGYKAVFPGVADIDSIMHYHRAEVIGDTRSTWGVLVGNPTQEQIRANGALLPVDFCINVTLNRERRITGFFCGDVLAAHVQGCDFAKSAAMVPCRHTYPIVVTTNSGYPLDQNLYQAVKGISAAGQIVEQDGFILMLAKCNEGFPAHGNFRKLLFEHDSPQAILDTILTPGFSLYDQWEAQLLALLLLKSRVGLYSDIPPGEVRRAHLEPVSDVTARIMEERTKIGADAPIAVLPEGPLTIPYLEA